MTRELIAVILGGGKGTRLYPLTKYRAKPAVPIAGKFRLIDIPVSNCLRSDIDRIFVLTQFNSTSLNRHIAQTYRFDALSGGYVQILAAQQTQDSMGWYQGTADAVRQNLPRFLETPCHCVLILSGDQLYKLDYQKMIQEHMESKADITVAVLPVERSRVKEFGILKTDRDGWIVDFVEKPQKEDEIRAMEIDKATFQQHGVQPLNRSHVASMGIYVFEKNALVDCLRHEETVDFGMHVIPASIGEKKVRAYFFDGYWEDVGTMRSFYEANLALTDMVPEFDFFDESAPVFTHARFLPGSKVNSCVVRSSILCEGSVLTECEIRNSIIGVRSIVHSGAEILNSVVMGADYYETIEDQLVVKESGSPAIGIGRGSVIRNAIIDKNARIGSNVKILNQQNAGDCDGDNYSICDGIVVIHKNAVLPDNTVI